MQNVIFQNDIYYTTGFKCFNHLNTEAGKGGLTLCSLSSG